MAELNRLSEVVLALDRNAKARGTSFYDPPAGDGVNAAAAWDEVAEFACTDVFRLQHILGYLEESSRLPGHAVECGVAWGGMSIPMAKALSPGRTLFMCDTYRGLPAPDPELDRGRYRPGQFRSPTEKLRARLAEHDVADRCELVEGLFADSLPGLVKEHALSFAYIDGDLYESTIDCLRNLYDVLPDGAPLVFDDYYDDSGGVLRAVNEHVARTGEMLFLGPISQVAIRKGVTTAQAETCFELVTPPHLGGHAVQLSIQELAKIRGYLAFCRAAADGTLPVPARRRSIVADYVALIDPDNAARPRSFRLAHQAHAARRVENEPRVTGIERKLRKLLRDPAAFFEDSRVPGARPLARLLRRLGP